MPRSECEQLLYDYESGDAVGTPCGKPSVEAYTRRGGKTVNLCAEHYDNAVRIQEGVKKVMQILREKRRKNE